jgi:hypothetical protein
MREKVRILHRQGAAARIRREAESQRKQAAQLTEQYAKDTDASVKAAAEALAKARLAEADARDALADAQGKGQDELMPERQESLRAAGEVTRLAGITLDARNVARQRAFTDDWVAGMRKNTPAAAMPEMDAFVASRTEAATAWTRLADVAAGTPAPDNEAIEVARDQAIAADARMNYFDRRRYFANDLARYMELAEKPGNEALLARAQELRAIQEKLLDTLKQQIELQAAMRPMERQRNAARDQAEQAWGKARR